MVEYIASGIIAVVLFLLAYFIYKGKRAFAIAGYEKGEAKEKDRLAKYISLFLVTVGIAQFALTKIDLTQSIYFCLGLLIYCVLFFIFIRVKF